VFVGALLLFPAPLLAGMITDHVQATVENIMAILQNAPPKPKVQTAEPSTLREVFLNSFDITEMAKRSLGSNWRLRTPKQRNDFVTWFTDLVESRYLHAMKPHIGEKLVCLREARDGEFAEVIAKMVARNGPEFPVSYRLRADKQAWRIYDVMIENMSLVNSYRSQFDRMLATAPFDELIGGIQEIEIMRPAKSR
jgi:phospholipid transport system substrate-binding protein